jgi:cellulose synthase/poly-beta-1,6-N-acetylglucosamine synthase-like glycosyltransferase
VGDVHAHHRQPFFRSTASSTKHPLRSGQPFELAAVEHLVDPALLDAAARRARELGVGGDEVLRAHGILSADRMAKALAIGLGIEFDMLDDNPPLSRADATGAARTGVLRRRLPGGRNVITIAPQGLGIRHLAAAVGKDPRLAAHLRITSPERFSAYLRRAGATELEHEAAFGLLDRRPDLSAASSSRHGLRKLAILTASLAFAAGYFFPHRSLFAAEIFLSTAFLCWIGLRLHACQMRTRPQSDLNIPERSLPYYSIIVPLYREARMAETLVATLNRFDYPREKLDIKLVCEADDKKTLAALAALDLDRPFEVIIAPAGGPRTKPKALQAALPFARGSFLVVYDAEDDPEPNQLHRALAAYYRGPPRLACVQARLAIDNVGDNWLTRHFAAEYAGLFDVFLPVLAELGLPLPLGGTSNHFRTEMLRAAGGWDPFNVTEDADLGMRLARFGYLSDVIDSTTYEEAPARTGAWIKQRTRWCKGWLQTWLVHMRSPSRLFRELGFGGFIAFQLLVGGTALAALVHPFFLAVVLTDATLGNLFQSSTSASEAFRQGLAVTTLASGYLGSAVLGFVGLARRKLLGNAWILLTIPLYWIFLSFAAWRAAIQLVTAPHLWEKTEHGLARTSRYGRPVKRGFLPTARKLKTASAGRPRPRQRFAGD